MKRTQRGDHLAQRADRRVLEKSGARPAKGAFWDQGGDPGDDGFGEGITSHVRFGALTRLATLAALWRPQVAPDAVAPIQAPTVCRRPPREGAARTSARRVRRSVQEWVSRCATMSERTMTRQRDQASPAPAGTEDRTRGPLVKTSQMVGDWSGTWAGEDCAESGCDGGGEQGEAEGRRDGSREKAGEQKRLGLAGGTGREGGRDSSMESERLVRSGPMKPGRSTGQGLGTRICGNDTR